MGNRLLEKSWFSTAVLLILLSVLSGCSLFVGVTDIAPSSLLWDREGMEAKIFLLARIPRLLAILCTGIGKSVAGLIMQQLCMNKFVSPSTGATIQSAQFGILLSLVFLPGIGLWGRVLLAALAAFLWKDLKLLDVITLGKDQAINLGVDYDRTVRRLLLGAVLCIAVATAMVGPISFLGLIIANLARQLLRTHKHAHLILGAALMGMLAIIAGQLISQHVFRYAVPISTFITIGGGIYFLYLLLTRKGGM